MSFIVGLSNKCYRRVVQLVLSEACPTDLYRRVVQWVFPSEGSLNGFQKQKSFVLKTIFIHGKCMCEGVSEDSRHETWHVAIHVEMCMFLLEWV